MRARHERDTLGLEQLLADLDVVREAFVRCATSTFGNR